MLLKRLEIRREEWGEDKGLCKGYIEFENEKGKVSVALNDETCQKLFLVVGEGIVDTAKECAKDLTIDVIEHQELLESQSEGERENA